MAISRIDAIRARIVALDARIAHAHAERNALARELIEVEFVEKNKLPGSKATRKLKGYLLFSRELQLSFADNPGLNISASHIHEMLRREHIDVNPNTLRRYLVRMKREGILSNNQGKWFLVRKLTADESANSRPPELP